MRRKACHPRGVARRLDRGPFHASFRLGEAPRQKLVYSVHSCFAEKGQPVQNQPSELTRSGSPRAGGCSYLAPLGTERTQVRRGICSSRVVLRGEVQAPNELMLKRPMQRYTLG
jgi:hypothetical protein